LSPLGRVRFILRDDGEEYGVMAQFYQNDELFSGRRFDRRMDPTRTPREMANRVGRAGTPRDRSL
jgi:hypothetical protein